MIQMKEDWERFQNQSGYGKFLILTRDSQKLFIVKNGKIDRCFIGKPDSNENMTYMMDYIIQ